MTIPLTLRKGCAIICATVIAAVLTYAASGGPAADVPHDNSKTWENALARFQQAGALIADGKHRPARDLLTAAEKDLTRPYSEMARRHREKLEQALKLSTRRDARGRDNALAELCWDLHAYQAALHLDKRARKSAEADDARELRVAWCQLEGGDSTAALAYYEKRYAEETVEVWRDFYKKHIEMICLRPAKLNDAGFCLEYVREHYLKSYDRKPDYLGALAELRRILPHAATPAERLAVYRLTCDCLSGLGDERGRVAWEDKLLAEFAADANACAAVFVVRGQRAFARKDFDEALRQFRRVTADYPNSASFGDAQYDVGLALQEQRKFAEAVAEFAKLIASNVNDRELADTGAQDYKNYRHKAAVRMSECYEATKDYARAAEFALHARDRYAYQSWCKTCAQAVEESLNKRIKLLQELAAAAP